MGGTLTVSSEGKSRGATFTLTLQQPPVVKTVGSMPHN
jgi:hypothetical protein